MPYLYTNSLTNKLFECFLVLRTELHNAHILALNFEITIVYKNTGVYLEVLYDKYINNK